jgi:hypothetical protein
MTMTGVWHCGVCGVTVQDSDWRRADSERTICRNKHTPVKMVYYESYAALAEANLPNKRLRKWDKKRR